MTTTLKDNMVKIVLIAMLSLASVTGAMVGWYINVLTTEVRDLSTKMETLSQKVLRLTIALEIQAGGNPFSTEEETGEN